MAGASWPDETADEASGAEVCFGGWEEGGTTDPDLGSWEEAVCAGKGAAGSGGGGSEEAPGAASGMDPRDRERLRGGRKASSGAHSWSRPSGTELGARRDAPMLMVPDPEPGPEPEPELEPGPGLGLAAAGNAVAAATVAIVSSARAPAGTAAARALDLTALGVSAVLRSVRQSPMAWRALAMLGAAGQVAATAPSSRGAGRLAAENTLAHCLKLHFPVA